MTYSIEFTPDRLTVTADLGHDDIRALIDALTVVTPLIGAGANRREDTTREPKQAKALRAEKALKVTAPEPQMPAVPEAVTEPERIDTPEPGETEYGERLSAAMDLEDAPPASASGDQGAATRRTAPPGSVPAERDERLRQLWAAGVTTHQIADQLQMGTAGNVSIRAKHLGLPSRKGRNQHTATPTDTHVRSDAEARKAAEADVVPGPLARAPTVTPAAPTNGHVFTQHGVSLSHDEISFNGKEMPVTESQYRLLQALLRAAPHPIGVPHLLSKVYPGKGKTEAEVVFGIVVKDLERNLPMVDLGLRVMKGIGISLTGSDAS